MRLHPLPLLLLSAVVCLPAPCARAVTPVAQFNDADLRAAWYEVAHLPDKREKHCAAGAMQLIARGEKNNQLDMVDTCVAKDGNRQEWSFSVTPADKHHPTGRLRTTTLFIFHHPYWLVALGPNHDWAAFATPNHRQLWIYSKSATLDPATLGQIETQLAAQGFNTAHLMLTAQNEHTVTSP